MIILDTNVIAALMSDPPNVRVVEWMDTQAQSSIWTTSITVLEIEAGLATMPTGKRQAAIALIFQQILDTLDHRVATFDEESARLAANLAAVRQKKGCTGDLRDTMIAGIVLARHASLATWNVTHFSDLTATVINPWTA